jgi:hypothetical protein
MGIAVILETVLPNIEGLESGKICSVFLGLSDAKYPLTMETSGMKIKISKPGPNIEWAVKEPSEGTNS